MLSGHLKTVAVTNWSAMVCLQKWQNRLFSRFTISGRDVRVPAVRYVRGQRHVSPLHYLLRVHRHILVLRWVPMFISWCYGGSQCLYSGLMVGPMFISGSYCGSESLYPDLTVILNAYILVVVVGQAPGFPRGQGFPKSGGARLFFWQMKTIGWGASLILPHVSANDIGVNIFV